MAFNLRVPAACAESFDEFEFGEWDELDEGLADVG